jgi:hypothetical protein
MVLVCNMGDSARKKGTREGVLLWVVPIMLQVIPNK